MLKKIYKQTKAVAITCTWLDDDMPPLFKWASLSKLRHEWKKLTKDWKFQQMADVIQVEWITKLADIRFAVLVRCSWLAMNLRLEFQNESASESRNNRAASVKKKIRLQSAQFPSGKCPNFRIKGPNIRKSTQYANEVLVISCLAYSRLICNSKYPTFQTKSFQI